MFKRNEETQAAPAATRGESRGHGSSTASIIGPTVVFKGELSADEDLIIEGRIDGTIAHQQKNLTVGKQGRVKANIRARTITIEGTVDGDVHGDELVRLTKSANVTGNLFSPRIQMDDGANFNGKIEMGTHQAGFAAAKDSAAKDSAAKDSAAKDSAAKGPVSKESVAKGSQSMRDTGT
ncbi:MAG: polymer-forming cytoskeletal protein [Gammaproteobacteria bacterium]|nr:polymer-forming cytoskeletal protein [Gammaproteobacteria bacterium]